MDVLNDDTTRLVLYRVPTACVPVLHRVCKRWHRLLGVPKKVPILSVCRFGYTNLLRDYQSRHPKMRLHDIVIEAAYRGHLNIIRLCYDWGADPNTLDRALCWAASGGHLDVAVALYQEMGATWIDQALCSAASRGHVHIMERCRSWGANDIENALQNSARSGRYGAFIRCVEWGATRFDDALKEASAGGHLEIVKVCLSRGANMFVDAARCARANSHHHIVKFLQEEGRFLLLD